MADLSIAPAGVSIAPLAACTRFSLRLRASVAAELGTAGPFHFDMPINSCAIDNGSDAGRTIARLGPDEWLFLGRKDDVALERELGVALAGRFFSLVDIGHRNTATTVSGTHAREVINAGCPLDLDDAAFPPYSATRTLLSKAEIVLLRPGAQAVYRLECWRSFTPYMRVFLQDAAREFGAS